jgi:uncharacterized protein
MNGIERGIWMKLTVLADAFAVCRLSPAIGIPQWALQKRTLLSITYTSDELSLICLEAMVPSSVQYRGSWRAIKVQGPLDFSLTGILVALAAPLAAAHIPIFALSTFDTDYLLLQDEHLLQAKTVLEQNGHEFI